MTSVQLTMIDIVSIFTVFRRDDLQTEARLRLYGTLRRHTIRLTWRISVTLRLLEPLV